MRKLKLTEIGKRGCHYCMDSEEGKGSGDVHCPYEECPYHELDGTKHYGDYMKKTNDSGLAAVLKELGKEG